MWSDIRQAELAPAAALVGDPVAQRVAGRVRRPRPAEQRLVQVAVRLDEAGQHQPAGHVDHVAGRRFDRRPDAVDPLLAHEHVGGVRKTPRPASAEEQGGHEGDRIESVSASLAARGRRNPEWPVGFELGTMTRAAVFGARAGSAGRVRRGGAPASGQAPAAKPNLLVLMTDDLEVDDLKALPSVHRLAQQGTTFSDSFVGYFAVLPVARDVTEAASTTTTTACSRTLRPDGGFGRLDHTNTLPV